MGRSGVGFSGRRRLLGRRGDEFCGGIFMYDDLLLRIEL